jgi:hypothetical protein
MTYAIPRRASAKRKPSGVRAKGDRLYSVLPEIPMPSRRSVRHAAVTVCLLIIVVAALSGQTQRTITPRPAFAEPSIAPDGGEIAFVSGGDIWTGPQPAARLGS